MIHALLLGLAVASAHGAHAQTFDPAPWRDRFASCVAAADRALDLGECKTLVATLCTETREDGMTTLGMTGCNGAEAQLWDDLLNADWPDHLAWAERGDTATLQGGQPALAKRGETLLAAQRAWIAFRDAECSLAYAAWGNGSMRNIASSSCRARLTADRVIALRTLTEGN